MRDNGAIEKGVQTPPLREDRTDETHGECVQTAAYAEGAWRHTAAAYPVRGPSSDTRMQRSRVCVPVSGCKEGKRQSLFVLVLRQDSCLFF